MSEWFEEQQTAAKRGRPIWNRMLKLLRTGKAQGVVIHKIDRSARNLKDWADLGELSDQGIEVHFANESLDLNSRGGRLSADIQAVVAADYIRNLREEAKKGIYGRLKQGFYPFRAPIGYLDNGAAKPKTIDPVSGPLVKKVFELYATARFGIVELSDEMFRRGLRNRLGTKVSRNGMSVLLNNPFYIGLIRIKKTNQMFQGNHEPLISKTLFEDAQDILSGRFNTRARHHEFLFRRVVKCKLCGYSMIGETQKGRVYYRCHTRACPTTGIREDVIESVVRRNLARLQINETEKQFFAQQIAELKGNWVKQREEGITALTMKLQQVSERLARLTDAYIDNALEKDLFEERKAAILFERREIEEGLSALKNNARSIPEEIQKFLELAGNAFLLYQSAILEKRRRLVKSISSNLAVHEKNVEFAFEVPFNEIANREKDIDGRPSKGCSRTASDLLERLSKVLAERPAWEFPLIN